MWGEWRKGECPSFCPATPSTLRLGTCSRRFPAPAAVCPGAASGLARSQNRSAGSPLRVGSVVIEKPGAFATPPTF